MLPTARMYGVGTFLSFTNNSKLLSSYKTVLLNTLKLVILTVVKCISKRFPSLHLTSGRRAHNVNKTTRDEG